MVETLILRLVQRWYLEPLTAQLALLNEAEQRAALHQAVISWLQTVLLILVIVQILFAGLLRLLPPELRATLGFLHRIEWANYVGILLVGAQTIHGYTANLIITNRFYLLGWRLGRMQIVRGSRARLLMIAYAILIGLLIAAILFVRTNGFIVQPPRP